VTNDQLAAIRAAAQAKGGPLTDAERERALEAGNRDAYRLRFANVVKIAGYSPEAVTKIVAEHFDKVVENVPEFIKMCESYEQHQRID
jgi:hypothetical protein